MALRDVLAQTDHRPYPLAAGPWVMTQYWRQLLFAHWAVEPEAVQRLLPRGLRVHCFAGQAYVAVVPFAMEEVRPRLAPVGMDFLELNVRTYVEPDGVYFWSLEASSALAVWGARQFFHLPYMHARMHSERREGWTEFRSERTHRGEAEARFAARYRPVGDRLAPEPLLDFLTERYCLYTTDARGGIYRGDIHHVRWPLRRAEAVFTENTMAAASGLELPATAPLLHYAEEIEVAIWPLRRHR